MNRTTIRKYVNNFSFLTCILLCMIIFTFACDNGSGDDETELIGNWFELSDFEGVPRSEAVAFTIGNKVYIGTGYDGEDRLNDFWEYDPDVNNWTQKADFPGVPRNGAVGFGTGNKGYIGTGYDGINKLNDFYEYNPATDTWTQITDFAGSARYGAVAFAIDDIGYVGTGYDGNNLKDLWKYDPASGEWTKMYSLGGGKRRDAVAFVIDGKGYVCTGIDNGLYETDFWEFDPVLNSWTKKRAIANLSDDEYDDEYSGITGIHKAAFSINGKGYIATGGAGTAGVQVWEYDPVLDLWEKKTSLEASGRIDAVGFSVGNFGFITTGRNGSNYFDDLWGFESGADQVDLDKMIVN